ncbi:MAG: ATP-dependent DNA helicase [Clostridia bacterium]|nr:ATP-dependent DNA helicase [Clostridia bacterium]
MRYNSDDALVEITADELSAYLYSCENPYLLSASLGFVPADDAGADNSYGYITEKPLRLTVSEDNLQVEITGTADSITFEQNYHTVEVCHSVRSFSQSQVPLATPDVFGKAVCLGHILCKTENYTRVGLKISFVRRSDSVKKCYFAVFTAEYLQKVFSALMQRAMPFIGLEVERCTFRLEELRILPFPYGSIREGQSDFITEAYRTIKSGGRLFVSAPTGIGKTISSLYPALRAVGAGLADKVFYLTAKNITGKAAVDAAKKLSKHAPHMRTILFLAKESMCNNPKADDESFGIAKCPFCVGRNNIGSGTEFRSYRQRQLEAVLAVLQTGMIYTPDLFKKIGAEYSVCPHELALDVSEYCDLLICDYNYVFDDRIRLHRYFKDISRNERYVFCVDEAHNLPDRTRSMYSASLSSSRVALLRERQKELFDTDTPFSDALFAVEDCLADILALCDAESHMYSQNGQEFRVGYYKDSAVPEELIKAMSSVLAIINRHIRSDSDSAAELSPFRDLFAEFLSAASYADKHFCFFCTSENGALTLQVLCLDPAGIIDTMLRAAKASILFSATLSPGEYYQNVTGSPDSVYLDLPSPYDPDNLCLMAFDGISTRFNDRKDTREDAAEIIAQAVSEKEGKYIAYFPSYEYMRIVCRKFRELLPDIPVIMQKKGMSYREREQFIRIFSGSKYPHVVGFCVLGGMFSEGIDLQGDSLIGVIIVGTGLPGLSAELNLVAEYYENTMEKGREFAYVYPGMNKVLQAAGRVIRSETDKGMVLLIDDRYSTPEMKLLFPPHWEHIRFTKDPMAVEKILEQFWNK